MSGPPLGGPKEMFMKLIALMVVAMAAPAIAGTMFRLEVGPPIAAGTGTQVTQQFKKKIVLVVRPSLARERRATLSVGESSEGAEHRSVA